jgi:hypothetical protein
MHFRAPTREQVRHTGRVVAGHGLLQGREPENASETDKATDSKDHHEGDALLQWSLNRPEQWHGHDVDDEIHEDVESCVRVENGGVIDTCAFHRLIPGQLNGVALKRNDEHVYNCEKGDHNQERPGELPQKVVRLRSEDPQIEDQERDFGYSDDDIVVDFSGIEKLLRRSQSTILSGLTCEGIYLTLSEPAKLPGSARSVI